MLPNLYVEVSSNNYMETIKLSKENFLQNIILPIKLGQTDTSNQWVLRNTNHEFIMASNSFLQKIFVDSNINISGCNLEILPFYDDITKNDLYRCDKEVVRSKSVQQCVTVFNVNGIVLVRLASMIPILFNNEVVAIDDSGVFVTQQHFDLELFSKINCIKVSKVTIDVDITKNSRDRQILFLLLLGKSCKEIAGIIGISKSWVIQKIEIMSRRADIAGVSVRRLVDFALAHNYHKKIPPEFFLVANMGGVS